MEKEKIAAITAIIVLIPATILALYVYQNTMSLENEKKEILSTISKDSTFYLFRVSSDINILLHLLEQNATVDVIRYKAEAIGYNAYTLSLFAHILYDHTGEQKYFKLQSAFSGLFNFMFDVITDEPSKIKSELIKNNETFSEISHVLREMATYRDLMKIPEDLVEELYNAVGRLSK
ncbi:hypothetical protein J4526_06395 [Desulfurococcaceae archaeon MEX13E-LK6-19]|nr:hypothetical protein J4526_06395 [Desulfurococcaceae archaeon MEX13E-LK6-19]